MLRGIIQGILGRRRAPVTEVSRTDEEINRALATELGVSPEDLAEIFHGTLADVAALDETQVDDDDAMLLIDRAAAKIRRLPHEHRSQAKKRQKRARLLEALPEPDRQIMLLSDGGMKYNKIAERLNMDEDDVLDGFVRIFWKSARMELDEKKQKRSQAPGSIFSSPGASAPLGW